MARQNYNKKLKVTVQLELTYEKVEPMEIYCSDWAEQVRKNIEEYAQKQLEEMYSDNVPEAVREYVRIQNGIKNEVEVATTDENDDEKHTEPVHAQLPEGYEVPENSCVFDE